MPWSDKGGWQGGGGPWGSGSGKGGGNGSGGDGGGRGPDREPPRRNPIDIDDYIRKGQDRFKGWFDGNGFRGYALLALVALVFWLSTGIYRVNTDEQGVVLRLGEFNRVEQPGLHYHWPSPIERVYTPTVTRVKRVEIGFRSVPGTSNSTLGRQMPEEALMLTGDENIIEVNIELLWQIADARSYLFEIRSPEETVRKAAEAAIREVMGRTPIVDALAEGKGRVEQETAEVVQRILDSYNSGIRIVRLQLLKALPPEAVIDAYRDVQRAEADMERMKNEAESYANDIIPRARGKSERMIQEAEAYKQQVEEKARGEAARFLSVYNEYRKAKDVTRKRIYLETLEDILTDMDKIVIDSDAGSGVVPYLPLKELNAKQGGGS